MPVRAHRLTIAGLLLSLSLAGCADEPATVNSSEEVFPVQTMTVQPGNMVQTLSAIGTVRYRRETPLGFTSAGKVARVRF